MITEWNISRIIGVVVFILLFVLFLIYAFGSSDGENGPVTKSGVSKVEIGQKPVAAVKSDESILLAEKNTQKDSVILTPKKAEKPQSKVEPVITGAKDNYPRGTEPGRVESHIYDKRISRAVIAGSLLEKEPVDIIQGPIKANKEKAIGVYFFTEINGMKGRVLYHRWYLGNKLVFKRKIHILGNHWRASTSKLMTYSQKGEWRAVLVNENNQRLAEVKFLVI